ncbi:MAG: transglutaminaseTgpA domain-containing protein, partial [Acidimicrobiales bacterium]
DGGRGRPGPSRQPPPSSPEGASPLVTVGTEIALVWVTAAAALGLARLFADGSFAGPVLGAVIGGHAVAWGCRRLGLDLFKSALLSLAGLALAIAWFVEPHTTTLLIPRGATWRAAVDDLRVAWERFGDVKAPTPPLRGFVLAAVAGTWLTATTSDFFAFRMRARFEAMAPAFTLFVFGAILGADALRLWATALYFVALLAFVLWSEAARQSRAFSWFAGRSREGDASLLRHGSALGLVALAVAVLVGPHLPGVDSAGLISLRDTREGGSRSRVTVSPLVDIRGRLVDQRDLELFTVQADSPSYWRLTSLDRFDGTIWSSLGTYQPARSTLPDSGTGRALRQQYSIGPLGTIWLPAAYRPTSVTGVRGARFDRDSGSLLAEAATADGLRYDVVSTVPDLTAALLAAAPATVPDAIADEYLALPDAFPGPVRQKSLEVTAGATSPYERARRLQDFFRSPGGFTYDLTVAAGHGSRAMERFLFESKRGYCEQFAGTFAAMARSIGLPARVAVGFVPGTAKDGGFAVSGKDAHAWPEVYIHGFGWVAFEPTPGAGRSLPGTQAYTGVGPAPANESEDPASSTTTTPTTIGDGSATSVPGEEEVPPEQTGSGASDDGTNPFWRVVLILAALAVLYALVVPFAQRLMVKRRRRAAGTATERVLVAWQEAEDALSLAGHPRRSSETAPEFARRSAPAVGDAGPQLTRLADETTVAGFSAEGSSEAAVEVAQDAALAVAIHLRDQAGPMRRLQWKLDPRPLVDAVRRRP